MKINKITPQLFSTQRINSKTQNNNNSQQTINYSYNPIAYQDYNINFTARLFRTPANFYEQPFNQSGMGIAPMSHGQTRCPAISSFTRTTVMSGLSAATTAWAISSSSTAPAGRMAWS